MQKRIQAGISTNAMRWKLLLATQSLIFVFAGAAAYILRFDLPMPPAVFRQMIAAVGVWVIVKGIAFQFANLNRRGLRSVSIAEVYRLLIANVGGSALSSLLILSIAPGRVPLSIYLMDLVLSVLATLGLRVAVRMVTAALQNSPSISPEKRTLIYGAGLAGNILFREIRSNPRLAYRICGFVDDDVHKQGMVIGGVPVLGGAEQIVGLIKEQEIELVLIAIPSATGPEMTRMLSLCHEAGVECKTVPGLRNIIEGSGLAGQIRDVAVEDLLGRVPVRLRESAILTAIEGKVLLVTGAAGSIGSELCRQIARFRPAEIIGFEIAESPLFEIDQEMKKEFPHVPFYPEIGSIQNPARLDEVFRKYKPRVVYHAAAYKHVPLMEAHVFEAIENNVFGTYNLAVAAAEHRVESFVLISSDKAVRPTNVMGATKRMAELLLQTLQNGGTQFITVRFGNVLGSSGSVIPIFKKQIAAGGPVTVTHPDMQRYFMTIPEACQLVLQAAAIAEGGQICVLDMGEPVKIVELARNLILLSGLKPDEDIRIEYSGIRPGEKLSEELSTLLEDTVPTNHSKIRIYTGDGLPDGDLGGWLDSMRRICSSRDLGGLVMAMKETVVDYKPSTELLRRMLPPQKNIARLRDSSKRVFEPGDTRVSGQ